MRFSAAMVASFGIVLAHSGAAQDVAPSYSLFGTPGLIDMPTAVSASDAELATTISYFGNSTRTTLSFQLTPRLTAAFRYSGLEGLGGRNRSTLFDRSFDLHYRLMDEDPNGWRPALVFGLRDFVGTGVYSSEYVVASKHITPKLQLTGGAGWGRLGGDTRAVDPNNLGGQIEGDLWFTGDVAVFGGLAWQATDKLQLKAEYSTDDYTQELSRNAFERDSRFNFGLNYQVSNELSLQAFYMYGNTLGASISIINQPKFSLAPSGIHPAPLPLRERTEQGRKDLGWTTDPKRNSQIRDLLAKAMDNEGLGVEALEMSHRHVEIWIQNRRFQYEAEAIGRTVRVLSQVMPDSIEIFKVVPVVQGVPASAVTLKRSDAEALEHAVDGPEKMLARVAIEDGKGPRPATFGTNPYPRLNWSLGPYFSTSYFDPSRPVIFQTGLQLGAEYSPSPGLFFSGQLRHRLAGNQGSRPKVSGSALPAVRSQSSRYRIEGETALQTLTGAYYFRPGKDLYGRFTAGYLEAMFGGVSAEVLWKPVGSKLGISAEANYVKQRDFDQQFGFRDYEVATGHISAYYEFPKGFHARVDAGRYLAGDWGATFSLDREFANGWRVGAFATLTDVSSEDFGEGSFDKGLVFTFPLSPFVGTPSRRKYDAVIRPLSRDGGARVYVDGRLYDTVRDFHASGLEGSWGRFWR